MKKDVSGRMYLTEAQAKEGVKIQVDGDFTCIMDGEERVLTTEGGDGGLGFECDEGFHSLGGQKKGGVYVGVYPVDFTAGSP